MLKKQNILKYCLTLCCVGCISVFLFAQKVNDPQSKWDEKLAELDQSKITSGILYNRVTPAAGLQNYNSEEKQNVAKLIHFRQAISELYRASKKQQFISSKELLKQVAAFQKKENEVLLGLIYAQFQMLNYNEQEPAEGGVLWDGENFELIEGRPLYLNKKALVVSPLQKGVKGSEIIFSLPEEFTFTNAITSIEELTADFGGGQKRSFIKNGERKTSTVSISYTESGEKEIEFEAKLSDGTTLKTKGMLYVVVPDQTNQRNVMCTQGGIIEDDFITSDIPFQGLEEDYGVYGRLDYRIFYRDNAFSARLSNPVIIIDGFDPGDKRRIQDCDCETDEDCAANYTFNGQYQDDGVRGHRAIEDLMIYPKNDGSFGNLISELRAEGYDVIIVNYPVYEAQQTNGQDVEIDGGADYIERNGITLTKLIRDINARITNSRYQMAVIGPSMGGQISRYALAYMEDRYEESGESEWQHNVRLWMSIDSPHLGANIPIGIQSLVDMLARADIEAAIDLRDNEIRSIAANQQLIEQHTVGGSSSNFDSDPAFMDAQTISQGFDVDHGSPFFIDYYDNLFNNGLNNSKGYPQNLRKIALANGSLTGSKLYYNPFDEVLDNYAGDGEKVINIRGFQNVCSPWPLCYDVHIASLEASFLGATGQNVEISRLKRGFIDNDAHATNLNDRGSMDNVPGGWFNSQLIVTNSVYDTDATNAQNSFWNGFGSAFNNIIEFISDILGGSEWQLREDDFSPVHAFIPTFSAFGHFNPNQSWNQALTNNLVCEGNIPFDSYYGESLNSSHTSFNENSVAWLMAELAGDPQEPFFPVDADKLVGPETVCVGVNYTYTFASCSTPGDVTEWQLSNNLSLVNSTGTSVTVTPAYDDRDPGSITAVFSNGVTVEKTLWVGRPSIPNADITGPSEVLTGALVTYNGGISDGADSYEWWLPGNFEVVSTIDYFADNWQIASYETDWNVNVFTGYGEYGGLVQQMGRNVCGLGGARTKSVAHINQGEGPGEGEGPGNELPDAPDGGIPFSPDQGDLSANYEFGTANDPIPDVSIFPNPAQTEVTLNLENIANSFDSGKALIERVELFDALMKLQMSKEVENGVEQVQLNISQLPSGVYKVAVHTNQGILLKQLVVSGK